MDILRSFQCDPIILYLSVRRSNNLFPVVNTLTLNTIFRVFIYHPLRYFTDITSRNCDTIVAPSIRWDDTYHKYSGLAIKPNRNIWITFFVKKKDNFPKSNSLLVFIRIRLMSWLMPGSRATNIVPVCTYPIVKISIPPYY